jgi:eukaryotic-like serine/threonine-protein kinase
VETISGYRLISKLGSGGMATVYLATQESLNRQVAIKVLSTSLIEDAFVQAQFVQESKLIASLNHPNIVQVIDQGISDQRHPYFVMPYIKSISLSAILTRNDVSIPRRIDIAIQICKALAYAHRNQVIHRDIKPDNLLIDYDGHVRLVDFGIAGYFKTDAQTNANIVMGTDAYMAPEQAEGVKYATHLSDIYSLGVVMHQLFLGGLPQQTTTRTNKRATDRHLEKLSELILHSIEPTPSKRPQSADDIRPQSADDIRQQLLAIAQGEHLGINRWNQDNEPSDLPADYRLLDVLKENPCGATYLVKDPKHKRFLVVKKQRLNHLGKALIANTKIAQIQHPHIVRILGTGKNGRVFITVSEYLGAGSLQERLTQAFTLGQWVMVAQQIFSALACAHEQGIVHGNLKPSNVLFAENNFIKIGDFGFPHHNASKNETSYLPPNEISMASGDIFSAGAILFELLSGELPKTSIFNWKNRWALRHIPKAVRNIILMMTHHELKNRYTTAREVMAQLQNVYSQQTTRMAEKVFIKTKIKIKPTENHSQ